MRPRALLLDCDGVIWLEGEAIPGSVEALNQIGDMGIRRMLVTNNSNHTRADYLRRAERIGLKGFTVDDILSSGVSCTHYLVKHGLSRVISYGSYALLTELQDAGITVLTHPLSSAQEAAGLDAIIVAKSPTFSYAELKYAIYLHKKFKCALIGTNPDFIVPGTGGTTVVGSGSVVACFESALRTRAVIVGKPFTPMFDAALKRVGCRPDEVMMVGDRLCTDIQFANSHGGRSVLVLTGIDRENDVQKAAESDRPTFVRERLADVLPLLQGMEAFE
jgi:4-nitrophenyl phosphatase